MAPSRDAPRTDFTVRCLCGTAFHTDDSQIGKSLRCRCGRTVVVARPEPAYVPPGARNSDRSHRRRKSHTPSSAAFQPIIPVRRRRWRHLLSRRFMSWSFDWRRVPGALSRSVAGSLSSLTDHRSIVRWTARLGWSYFALLLLTWIALITTSERFIPATLLAYGPRVVVMLPLAVLAPLALVVSRATLLPLACATWVGVHSIMGFRVSWETLVHRSLPTVPEAGAVRVMTFNVLEGGRLAFDLPLVINELAPDIVAFQECGDRLWEAVQALPAWHSYRLDGLCTASRWPIRVVDSMPRRDLQRVSQMGAGGTGLAVRLTLDTPHGALQLVNLHLETVRKGLEAVIGAEGFLPDHPLSVPLADPQPARSAGATASLNSFVRSVESARASMWATHGDRSLPLVVVGDFNLPVESAIYRRNWSQMIDAFESSGTGFGWTKREGSWLRVRIDHILVDGDATGFRPLRAVLGPDYSSDHLPVIADLAWPTRR